MPHTDSRSVREDYWYTSAQVVDVGTAWADESLDRLFLYSDREIANRTALTVANAPALNSLPKKILLPLNKGSNHWAAVAISINETEDHRINIRVSFTDSLNTSNKRIDGLSPNIKRELVRIKKVLSDKYGSERLNIVFSIYPHSWPQPDGSSCGPYALANAARCLAGKGQEPNPGRKAIREQQLNMMIQGTAIIGCSTSNNLDEILLDWILDHAGKSLRVTTPRQVEAICIYYAKKHKLRLSEVSNIFHGEYCTGTKKPWYRPVQVNTRIRELIGEYGIRVTRVAPPRSPSPAKAPARRPARESKRESSRVGGYESDYSKLSLAKLIPIFQSNEDIQRQVQAIRQENLCKKIDDIRIILTKRIGDDDVYVMQLMELLVLAMLRVNQNEAEALVKTCFGEQQNGDCEDCLQLISEVIGARHFADDNNEKFIYLASAYKSLADAMQRVRDKKFADLEIPKQVLRAHLQLLEGAIERNSASAIRQVSFAIGDFCATLLQYLTFGNWVAETTRIKQLSQKFTDSEGNISTEMLRRERASINTILTARERLANDSEKDEVYSGSAILAY